MNYSFSGVTNHEQAPLYDSQYSVQCHPLNMLVILLLLCVASVLCVTPPTTHHRYQVITLTHRWDSLDKKRSTEAGLAECGVRCAREQEDDNSCNTFQYNKDSKVCARGTITPPMVDDSQSNSGIRTFVKLKDNGLPFEDCPESHPYAVSSGSSCCNTYLQPTKNISLPTDVQDIFLDYESPKCSGELACDNYPCINHQNREHPCNIEDVILEGIPSNSQ